MRHIAERFLGRLGLIVALAGFAGSAWAHGGHAHVMGIFTAADAKHIEVKAKDGKLVSLAIDNKTTFKNQDGSAAKAADVSVGQRVMIDVDGEGDAKTAREVTLGAKAKVTSQRRKSPTPSRKQPGRRSRRSPSPAL